MPAVTFDSRCTLFDTVGVGLGEEPWEGEMDNVGETDAAAVGDMEIVPESVTVVDGDGIGERVTESESVTVGVSLVDTVMDGLVSNEGGSSESEACPSPSWPFASPPQQRKPPSDMIAHVCA